MKTIFIFEKHIQKSEGGVGVFWVEISEKDPVV